MAKKLDPKLLEILQKYGERPEDALWDCHGTWVAYHAAIERIAAQAGVKYYTPTIIHQDPSKGEVTICVTGKMGEREEWSFGEVSPKNNKNSYPYAMAEKRAKDRVTLKLVGLSGSVYSEEESDDFKPVESTPPPKSSMALKKSDENGEDAWDRLTKELYADFTDCHSLAALSKIRQIYREKAVKERWNKSWLGALANEFDTFEEELKSRIPEAFEPEFANRLEAENI